MKLPGFDRRARGRPGTFACVGIDLGTTYSAVAWVDANGRPVVITDDAGRTTMPSIVHFGAAKGAITVGNEARELGLAEPERTVMFVKREMGMAPDNVRPDLANVPHPYEFWGRRWSPSEVSACILRELKLRAEKRLGLAVPAAVVTVPAYFRDPERAATVKAAELAGLEVIGLLNEPTAAGLAAGLKPDMVGRTALVFDLGGGTCDVTLLRVDAQEIRVAATAGDHRLGGKDWDDALIRYVEERRGAAVHDGIDLDAMEAFDLREKSERAKRMLSATDRAEVVCVVRGRRHAESVSRETFESLTSSLVARCENLVSEVVAAAGTSLDGVDVVVLAGGATRMPAIRRSLESMWRRPLNVGHVNPDECVAIGAAIMAAREEARPIALIGHEKVATATAARLQQAPQVHDVTGHSLGFITSSGSGLRVTRVIPANSPVPCACTRDDLTTTRAGQEALEVHIVEGESDDPWLCTRCDSFECSGIDRRLEAPRIAVTFRYDQSGIVSVDAVETCTGKTLKVKRIAAASLEDVGRGSPVPMDVVLALDTSGSMCGAMGELREAARRFVEEIDLGLHRVGIVQFGASVGTAHCLSTDAESLGRAMLALSADGGTPMGDGIRRAHRELARRDPEASACIVVMSDGAPNSRDDALAAAGAAKDDGCIIATVACGGADRAFMELLASGPGCAYDVTGTITIGDTFCNLAREISSGGITGLRQD